MLRKFGPLLLMAYLAFASPAPGAAPESEPELEGVSKLLYAHFNDLTYATWASDLNWSRLRDIYHATAWQPLWLTNNTPTEHARQLRDSIVKAQEHALLPEEYHEQALRFLWTAKQDKSLARLDLLLTDAFLRYSVEIRAGYQYPRVVDYQWYMDPPKVKPGKLLQAYLDATDPEKYLATLSPQYGGYRALRQAMLKYQAILNQAGEWKPLPEGPLLKLGSWGYDVLLLRMRLLHEGYSVDNEPADEYLLDRNLEKAVRAFQSRYGHKIDGLVGKRTRRSLNIPLSDRIKQIQRNLERWRWLPRSLGDRYVMVNMAGYRLQYIEHDETVLSMRVIIGKPFRATPAFRNDIKYLVLNPTWNIPPRIARDDLLPKIKQTPDFLQDNNIHVFENWTKKAQRLDPGEIDWMNLDPDEFKFKLQQAAGENNSLGRIKFMFPNSFRVYLHDTPSRDLFNQRIRTFSSGCIRVERPISLARALLKNDKTWSKRRLRKSIWQGETIKVDLNQPVPIYLLYWTSWADEEGVHFRDDIYERDQRIVGGELDFQS